MHIGRTISALIVSALLITACSNETNTDQLVVDASIASTTLTSSGDAVLLDQDQPVVLDMSVSNPGSEAVRVRYVRVVGGVMTLRVAHTNTAVDFTVAPGATRDLALELDFFDLGEQASGLVDAELILLDSDRSTLASQPFTAEVGGTMMSSLGLSTIMVAAFALASVVVGLVGVTRRTLPGNRLWRGLQLGVTGLACGLAVMLALPSSGLWLPPAGVWAPVLLISAAAGFGLGWISPGPDILNENEELIAAAAAA